MIQVMIFFDWFIVYFPGEKAGREETEEERPFARVLQ